MNSKGQVTVFIIVGIIILLVAAIILYITSITITEEIETEGRQFVETVPQEFVAIQEYTEACLDSVAEQGIIVLGQQGGYLYPSNLGDYSITNPTDSVGVNLDPVLVPYWHYNANPNGEPAVAIATLQPALHDEDDTLAGGSYMSIESQLGRYVEEEIERCLNSYEVFSGQGFVIEYGEKSVNARVWDGYVDFTLEMPMVASREDASAEMTQFYADLDVDLQNIYDVASEITVTERNQTFLESHLLNVLSVHMGLDQNRFPPVLMVVYDQDNPSMWVTSELKFKLKDLLNSYVPVLRYYGAKNFYRYEYPVSDLSNLYQQVSDDMILPLESAPEYNIDFNYFSWEPYLDLNAGQEEVKPSEVYIKSPLDALSYEISFQKYLNTYDISYPVLVTIEDPEAFKGKGYTFNFALESNIINNEPVTTTSVVPGAIILGQDSLLCNQEQKNTEMISALVVDSYTKEPLDMVQFGFSIPDYDRCQMGVTDEGGVLETSYPAAYGGVLDLKANGYLPEYYSLDTYLYKDTPGFVGWAVAGFDTPVIELYPVKEVEVSIQKKTVEKCIKTLDAMHCVKSTSSSDGFEECMAEPLNRVCMFNSGNGLFLPSTPDFESYANGSSSQWNEYYFVDSAKNLVPENEVFFMLERVSDVGGDAPGISSDSFTVVLGVSGGETTTAEFVPGVYKVTATNQLHLSSENPYYIPSDERCITSDKDDCFNLTDSTLDDLIGGMMEWNDEDTYLTITAEDLYNSDSVTFYVIEQDFLAVPQTVTSIDDNGDDFEVNARLIEDLSALSKVINLSRETKVRNALEPKWVNTLEIES
ncbi:MAG: hypothetical protein ABIG93_04225 [archaeon]|nr:hypothetical protein [Nanoarchaeota archaeon]